jgi:hypothetical protein
MEFKPAGVHVVTEDEFPDLDNAFGSKPKTKAAQKKVIKVEGPSEEDLKT